MPRLVPFDYRDQAPYTDSNVGQLTTADTLDASLSLFLMNGALKLSAFGKNLKDEVTIGNDSILPEAFAGGPLGGGLGLPSGPIATFSPLNKGRIVGFEMEYNY